MTYGTFKDFSGFLQISRKGQCTHCQPNEKIVSISELTDMYLILLDYQFEQDLKQSFLLII